jgi:hypothetical protein
MILSSTTDFRTRLQLIENLITVLYNSNFFHLTAFEEVDLNEHFETIQRVERYPGRASSVKRSAMNARWALSTWTCLLLQLRYFESTAFWRSH